MEQNKNGIQSSRISMLDFLPCLYLFCVEVSARIFKFETIGTQEKYLIRKTDNFKVPINEKDQYSGD